MTKISEAIKDLEKISPKQYTYLIGSGIPKEAALKFTQSLMQAAVEQKVVLIDDTIKTAEATILQIKMLTQMGYIIDTIPTFELAKKIISNFIVRAKSDSEWFDPYFKESYQEIFKEMARAKKAERLKEELVNV
jgi:hypothetical protein